MHTIPATCFLVQSDGERAPSCSKLHAHRRRCLVFSGQEKRHVSRAAVCQSQLMDNRLPLRSADLPCRCETNGSPGGRITLRHQEYANAGRPSRTTSRRPIERPALAAILDTSTWSTADGPVQTQEGFGGRMSCISTEQPIFKPVVLHGL